MRGFARAYMAISAGRSILGKLFRVNATKSCERRSTSCICVDKRLWRSHCVFHIDGTSQRQKIRQRRKIAKSFHNYYCEEHRLLLSAARVLNDYVITFEIYLARSLFLRYAIKLIRMCFRWSFSMMANTKVTLLAIKANSKMKLPSKASDKNNV